MRNIVLLSIFVGCLSSTYGLSCLPCYMANCTTPACDESGYTLGICGCCDVCAKTFNSSCGGTWGMEGTCDKNLTCYHSAEQLPDGPKTIYPEGTCVDWHCRAIIDVVIAVDGSDSIGGKNIKSLKNVLRDFVMKIYEMYGACAHVEIIQFSDVDPVDMNVSIEESTKFRIPFALGECINNKDCVQRRLDAMEYLGGGTNGRTYYALRRIREVELKKSSRATRSQKIAVVVTEGAADEDAFLLLQWHKQATTEGTIIPFAIGIGDYDKGHLQTIANGGGSSLRVFDLGSFPDLNSTFVENEFTNALWSETVHESINCSYPEVYSPCTNPDCDLTCENRFDTCIGDCKGVGCVCAEGYVRMGGGNSTCVKYGDCPTCEYPKVYKSCTSCTATCDNPDPICAAVCGPPGCVCPDGYVQRSNEDDTCVKRENCNAGTCKYPEVYKNCTSHCPPTCENPNPMCIQSCAPAGCVCADGFVLKSDFNRTCVKPDECDVKKCTFPEVHSNCASPCHPTCAVPQPVCIEICQLNTCVCAEGYVRRSLTNNTCIKKDTCEDKTCMPPMIHTNCASACPETCETINRNEPIACPAICIVNECICPRGMVLRSLTDRVCVAPGNCTIPPTICPHPKVFQSCPSVCPATCDNPNPGVCTRSDKQCATDKCVCPPDHVLFSETDRRCVHAYECPPRNCMKSCAPLNFTGCSSQLADAWSCHLSNWICSAYEWKLSIEEWWYTNGCYSVEGMLEYRWREVFNCPAHVQIDCIDEDAKRCQTDAFGCIRCQCERGAYRDIRQLQKLWKVHSMKYQDIMKLYNDAKMICASAGGSTGEC